MLSNSRPILVSLLKNLYWIEKKKLAWRMNLDVIAQNIQEVLTEIKTENNLTKCMICFVEFV